MLVYELNNCSVFVKLTLVLCKPTQERATGAATVLQAHRRGAVGRRDANRRVDHLLQQLAAETEAARRIQAVHRGNVGRAKADQFLEHAMQEEMRAELAIVEAARG